MCDWMRNKRMWLTGWFGFGGKGKSLFKQGILTSLSNTSTGFCYTLTLWFYGLYKYMDEKVSIYILTKLDHQICFAKISILFPICRNRNSHSEVEKGNKLLKLSSLFEATMFLNLSGTLLRSISETKYSICYEWNQCELSTYILWSFNFCLFSRSWIPTVPSLSFSGKESSHLFPCSARCCFTVSVLLPYLVTSAYLQAAFWCCLVRGKLFCLATQQGQCWAPSKMEKALLLHKINSSVQK